MMYNELKNEVCEELSNKGFNLMKVKGNTYEMMNGDRVSISASSENYNITSCYSRVFNFSLSPDKLRGLSYAIFLLCYNGQVKRIVLNRRDIQNIMRFKAIHNKINILLGSDSRCNVFELIGTDITYTVNKNSLSRMTTSKIHMDVILRNIFSKREMINNCEAV